MEKLTEFYSDLMARDVELLTGSYHLSGDCDALTLKLEGRFAVCLDIERIRTLVQEKEAVSHEWGHIVTDATYGIDAPPALRQMAECQANRAQLRRLLPYEELRDAMAHGMWEVSQLADYFTVTEDTVRRALEFYTGPCGLTFQ